LNLHSAEKYDGSFLEFSFRLTQSAYPALAGFRFHDPALPIFPNREVIALFGVIYFNSFKSIILHFKTPFNGFPCFGISFAFINFWK
jgi:hypothetical protein